jgi:hypothetical protein
MANIYIPLPFSRRTTAAVCVFACHQISGPYGAQVFAFGDGIVLAQLQTYYAQLFSEYRILRHQDVVNQENVLNTAISNAVTTVTSLKATIDSLMARPNATFILTGYQIVVANALVNLLAAQNDAS